MKDAPYSLMAELEKYKGTAHPPVDSWNPSAEKDIDLVIKHDGTWMYLGTPIKRPRLVRLFASVLRKDSDDYFLVTPVEKCRIQVEDVPFQVILMSVSGEARDQLLTCTTDMAEEISIDEAHPLRIAVEGEQWIPYVMVRGGMEARLNRNVYYQLTQLLVEETGDDNESWLGVWSAGRFFRLMRAGG